MTTTPTPASQPPVEACTGCWKRVEECQCVADEQPSPARSDKDADHARNCFAYDSLSPICHCTCGADIINRKARAAQESAPSSDVREAFDAAFLSWNGFHTKAELDAEWARGTLAGEMFRAGAALARRATAGTEEIALRRLLAGRVAGALLYEDDGELLDNTGSPWIDYRRDSAAEIEAKLIKRGVKELECATAGNAAPTEAEAVEGGASALRAEPAGQHEITRLDVLSLIREHTHRCYVAGVDILEVDPKYAQEIDDALRSLEAGYKSDARCCAEGGVTCNNSSSELASNTAPAAPGDLPHFFRYDLVWSIETGDEIKPQDSGRFVKWDDVKPYLASNAGAAPGLTVWEGPMPESNGKSNFTAILMRKDGDKWDNMTDGITIERSEYPDRVRYEADRVRHLIGELSERPCILDYDANKHSGYAAPSNSPAGAKEKE